MIIPINNNHQYKICQIMAKPDECRKKAPSTNTGFRCFAVVLRWSGFRARPPFSFHFPEYPDSEHCASATGYKDGREGLPCSCAKYRVAGQFTRTGVAVAVNVPSNDRAKIPARRYRTAVQSSAWCGTGSICCKLKRRRSCVPPGQRIQ